LKFNVENKNGAALRPRQVVMRSTMNHLANPAIDLKRF
jgi:hypothetical protein